MEDRMKQAREALEGEITFAALLADGRFITSEKKGIVPMMALLQADEACLRGACVADRVIGRAAALLMEKAGVAAAYGEVISSYAKKAFLRSGICFSYEKETAYIINRTQTGMCPMEEAVLEITDAQEAYIALQRKLEMLARGRGE